MGGDLLVRVSARARTGEYLEPIPYALAPSIKVGVGSTIHAKVRVEIEASIRSPISTR
jgi:hypothetical protein